MIDDQTTIKQLREFYGERKISAVNLGCPSQSCCRGATEEHGGTFTTAREVGLGVRYLDGTRPRILVVSLDPGSYPQDEHSKPKTRMMESQICREPRSKAELGSSNCHWYRTHEGVACLVNALAKEALAKEDKETITVNEAALWFAHTSVVRCCANLPSRRQAPREMFWSCRDYLRREIEILTPDIIWTQGGSAFDAMSWLARYIEPATGNSLTPPQKARRIRLNSATWVHTNYPTRGWEKSLCVLRSASWNPTPAES